MDGVLERPDEKSSRMDEDKAQNDPTHFEAYIKGLFIKDIINQGGRDCQKMILLNKLI